MASPSLRPRFCFRLLMPPSLAPLRFMFLAAWLSWSATAAVPTARPNVLIVLTDDQGMGDFSCYGNPVLKTPNLDRLREQCVRFTDFHVAPMCTPTRGQLLTGQDAVRNGATSVTGGRSFIRPGIPTLPELFAAAGYRTGMFGKWHLGDNYPHRPMDRGFQEAICHLGWGFTSAPEFANTLLDGRYFHDGVEKRFSGYCTDFWFERAMAWMKERQAARQPFLCYLPLNAPHGPHVVPEKYSAPYEGKGPAKFFGMIANLDENIGRLEAFLRDTGLRDNTILIFMTDNGGTAGVKLWNAGLRAGKTTFYDGGHRVPCWVRWPIGALGEPRDIATPAQVQDILPTLLDLCVVNTPPSTRFDGVSLAGLLRVTTGQLPDRKFVVQYSRAKLEKWECGVIWNQWRLVHGKELYDVAADRAQQTDLAAKHPDIVAKLREHYERWWTELEPLSREFVATSLGAEKQPLVTLTSSDWQDVYADNAGHVRQAAGGPRGGHWNVRVERAGEYEISLRRWPAELDTALTALNGDGSRALPITGAKLTVGGQELSEKASPGAKEIKFQTRLPVGPIRLQGWFSDDKGSDLCGAFYATVRRLP
ncbi:MAG: arylsulfatase [Verrucomicrobia bacterium]|nr:arylsulfatase [Verrucomicrobiota bacterium]